jgi:hypothetical protein
MAFLQVVFEMRGTQVHSSVVGVGEEILHLLKLL